ncbi:hypothetical protein BP6252_08985 [Coleophoma cylindrospora]|uniref:Zn(2)-C6 fungal-type domain-containing protein n=1 Tax=Coleophoma cylindrospora TaxID=1849047 RepID=A0A3D8R0M6_9HELO|nr:hypothetical protein BP6252_08985 [Coleophoma cylindrospora]
MARTAGRSRGCRTCRQRRIKCDEALPECTQCKKYGTKCPGPITGTFYVIASETCTRPSSTVGGCVDAPESSQMSNTYGSTRRTPDLDIGNRSYQPPTETNSLPTSELLGDALIPTIPSYYQPSRAEAFDQLFFSHFFDGCGKGIETIGACSWLGKLPARLATSFTSRAIKYSVRATCMAFYGVLNGQVSIQTEARRTYVRALESRRADLGQGTLQTQMGRIPVSEEDICLTLVLSYYELVLKTSPAAWVHHLHAAAAMIEAKGPEECQSGFMHQLFRTVRLGIAFSSVAAKTPHIFSQKRWVTIPFQGPKTELDILVDVLLSIPEHALIADRMIGAESILDVREPLQDNKTAISALLSKLDGQTRNKVELLPQADSSLAVPWQEPRSSQLGMCWDSVSMCLSVLRHTTYLICFALLASISTESSGTQSLAAYHSEAILGVVEYTHTRYSASSLYMTTIFSLDVICIWSPSAIHQACARRKLEDASRKTFA